MKRIYDLLDRTVLAFVTQAPGWLVVLTAVFLYTGVGLALPLALHWRTIFLIEANLLGTVFAAVVCLVWVVVQTERGLRRCLVEWTTELRLLNSSEFEWLVGEVFRRDGWAVKESGRQDGPDGNVDLELSRDGRRRIVQCKRWVSWQIGVDEVRAFGGTLLREQLPGRDGLFVTLSDFTEQARQEAHKMEIELMAGRELYRRMQQARRLEPCPKCEKPMVFDHSPRGWWFRCNSCDGKWDLGAEPGRVVGLLLDPNTS